MRISSHSLRYVLRNRKTDEPLMVLVFTLVPKDQVEENGKPAEEKKEVAKAQDDDDGVD